MVKEKELSITVLQIKDLKLKAIAMYVEALANELDEVDTYENNGFIDMY